MWNFWGLLEYPLRRVLGLSGNRVFCTLHRRYGNPKDFMYLVDYLHTRKGSACHLGLGTGSFPEGCPRAGLRLTGRPSMSTKIPGRASTGSGARSVFDYGKKEVRNLLCASAQCSGLKEYHHGRSSGRCGFLHALSGLRQRTGGVDSQHLRRQSEPGSSGISPAMLNRTTRKFASRIP